MLVEKKRLFRFIYPICEKTPKKLAHDTSLEFYGYYYMTIGQEGITTKNSQKSFPKNLPDKVFQFQIKK